MTALIIRYGLPALLIIAVLVWVGLVIHDNGRTIEREKWEAREIEQRDIAAETLNAAREEVAAISRAQQMNLTEVINAKAKSIENLKRDLHHATNRGLYVSAEACPNNNDPVPGAAAHPVNLAARPARVRLPEADAARLRRAYELAQETVVLYQTCRGVVAASNVEMIYPVGEKPK